MAPKPAVLMDGFREARRDVRAIDRKLDRQLAKDIKTVSERVLLPRAKALAPKRTGALAGSIKVSAQQRGVTIGSRLPYANVIHWGGNVPNRESRSTRPKRHFKRRPFLVRAAQVGGPQLEEGVAKALDGFMRRHGFK